MAVKYVIAKLPNPMNRDVKKYYARARAVDQIGYNDICKMIGHASSATQGDISLVLDSAIFEMVSNLAQGRIVRLGNFGTFQMSINSEGSEKVEDFNQGLIKKSRIVFRPGPLLKDMCATATYEVLDKRLWPQEKP